VKVLLSNCRPNSLTQDIQLKQIIDVNDCWHIRGKRYALSYIGANPCTPLYKDCSPELTAMGKCSLKLASACYSFQSNFLHTVWLNTNSLFGFGPLFGSNRIRIEYLVQYRPGSDTITYNLALMFIDLYPKIPAACIFLVEIFQKISYHISH